MAVFFLDSPEPKQKKVHILKNVARVYNSIFHKFDFENKRKWLQGTMTSPLVNPYRATPNFDT